MCSLRSCRSWRLSLHPVCRKPVGESQPRTVLGSFLLEPGTASRWKTHTHVQRLDASLCDPSFPACSKEPGATHGARARRTRKRSARLGASTQDVLPASVVVALAAARNAHCLDFLAALLLAKNWGTRVELGQNISTIEPADHKAYSPTLVRLSGCAPYSHPSEKRARETPTVGEPRPKFCSFVWSISNSVRAINEARQINSIQILSCNGSAARGLAPTEIWRWHGRSM